MSTQQVAALPESEEARRFHTAAEELTYTCYQMYARTKTGLAPEFVRTHFDLSIQRKVKTI